MGKFFAKFYYKIYAVGIFAERSKILMNTYEKLNKLGEIIGELTVLYRELSEELPKLEFVGAGAPADSELKKMNANF